MDATDSLAEAVAIAGGKVLAVGRKDEVLPFCGPATKRIDLAGPTVVPGFVDAHPHLDLVGLKLTKPAFDNPASIADILAVIAAEVVKRKPGEWIVCNPIANEPDVFGYPARLKEGRLLSRQDLDTVSPNNPVYIEPPQLVAPGHAFANSAAILSSGVTAKTEVPPGVKIEVDASGEPTGVFTDINFPKKLPVRDGAFVAATSLFPTLPELTDAYTLRAVWCMRGIESMVLSCQGPHHFSILAHIGMIPQLPLEPCGAAIAPRIRRASPGVTQAADQLPTTELDRFRFGDFHTMTVQSQLRGHIGRHMRFESNAPVILRNAPARRIERRLGIVATVQ